MKASNILLFLNLLAETYHLAKDEKTRKDLLHLAAGMAAYSKDKVEQFFEQHKDKQEELEAKGKDFLHDLLEGTEEIKEKVGDMVDHAVERALKKLNVPTQSDVEALEAELSRLEEAAGV